jgi:hypothetical protein
VCLKNLTDVSVYLGAFEDQGNEEEEEEIYMNADRLASPLSSPGSPSASDTSSVSCYEVSPYASPTATTPSPGRAHAGSPLFVGPTLAQFQEQQRRLEQIRQQQVFWAIKQQQQQQQLQLQYEAAIGTAYYSHSGAAPVIGPDDCRYGLDCCRQACRYNHPAGYNRQDALQRMEQRRMQTRGVEVKQQQHAASSPVAKAIARTDRRVHKRLQKTSSRLFVRQEDGIVATAVAAQDA